MAQFFSIHPDNPQPRLIKQAAEMLRDDLEVRGPVRLSEVETAQKEILGVARRLADAGEIVLGGKPRATTWSIHSSV